MWSVGTECFDLWSFVSFYCSVKIKFRSCSDWYSVHNCLPRAALVPWNRTGIILNLTIWNNFVIFKGVEGVQIWLEVDQKTSASFNNNKVWICQVWNKCLCTDVLYTLFFKKVFLKCDSVPYLTNKFFVNPESLPYEHYRHLHNEFKEQSF